MVEHMKECPVMGDGAEQRKGDDVEPPTGEQMDCLQTATEMGTDLIERILCRLPLDSSIRCASLSKRMYSLISSPAFTTSSIARRYPFFYLWGLHPLTHQTLACMYDPVADRWFSLNLANNMPPLSSPFHAYSLTSTASGTIILYLTSIPSSDNLCLRFACNPTDTDWKISSAAAKCFDSFPVVAAFDSPSSSASSFEAFVLGELYSGFTVQLYHSATNLWEVCNAQPTLKRELYQFMGSSHVSSAVVGRKVFLATIAQSNITSFDMGSKSWSTPLPLQAWNTRSFIISSTKGGLYALGLCALDETEECVKLFQVNERTMECKEVTKMPHHLWSLLSEEFEQGTNSLSVLRYVRCVGAGSLVYVYNGSYFNKIRVCVCDVDAGYKWHQLPLLPEALQCLGLRTNSCSFLWQPNFCLKSQHGTAEV